jgi:hypothetical protein
VTLDKFDRALENLDREWPSENWPPLKLLPRGVASASGKKVPDKSE